MFNRSDRGYTPYFLNDSGTRWYYMEQGKKTRVSFTTTSGKTITRTAIEYRSYGAWVKVVINYNGKRVEVAPEAILDDWERKPQTKKD